jgi:phosphohistidine phosphatase
MSNQHIHFKNIILWRHAEAVDLEEISDVASVQEAMQNDATRAITLKGHQQAKKMASWLARHLPKDTMLHCSPALRAFQTAQALNYKINVNSAFKPNATLQQVLMTIEKLSPQPNIVGNLLVVGHQPWIGQLAASLLCASDCEMNIKKGAIWWLRQLESMPGRYEIMTVQIPTKL